MEFHDIPRGKQVDSGDSGGAPGGGLVPSEDICPPKYVGQRGSPGDPRGPNMSVNVGPLGDPRCPENPKMNHSRRPFPMQPQYWVFL